MRVNIFLYLINEIFFFLLERKDEIRKVIIWLFLSNNITCKYLLYLIFGTRIHDFLFITSMIKDILIMQKSSIRNLISSELK